MNNSTSCSIVEESVFVVDDEAVFENTTNEDDAYWSVTDISNITTPEHKINQFMVM